ncbi:helix-turn-helix domain-containing protein [Mucilaginibacter sp. RB4R14]|uniref:helix-turn-helix domain-containing protein n=1 Tax=Mucilaginibacter aurantiaciroseus TaxID=2949308 RepID=UPI002090472D|nr:helix-turn-helix transcriptional regulator [Mucilaginibacter aurantiaciroseus]MCO5934965.1 helix-turn-helix domain-containing protein [Mucilaginibacter aurantiaciroseus]
MKNEFQRKVEDIINNIRVIRERKNYSQDYIAMKMNSSQNAYSKLELGYSKLTLAKLLQICNILEVNLVDVLHPRKPKAPYKLVQNPVLSHLQT